MKIRRVFSKSADYQKFEVLQQNRNKRYKYGEFIVEGVRNINEAVKNNWQISSFLYTRETPLSDWAEKLLFDIPVDVNYELSEKLMGELSGKTDRSELLAIVRMREDTSGQFRESENPLFVLFDRPSNKGNLGTIIRSCDALDASGLILTGHAVDLYDPDVVTASMGSFFNFPTIRRQDKASVQHFIEQNRSKYANFKVYGTTAHKQNPVYGAQLAEPVLLMIGNETDGLSRGLQELCDALLTIPMAENGAATSFNVGCAATVFLYEAVRQRAEK